MTDTDPPSVSPGALDAAEAAVWRGIVELLLAQGDTIADAMPLADALVRQRRARRPKDPPHRARSGVRPRLSSIPPAIPHQPSKVPVSAAVGSTMRSQKR